MSKEVILTIKNYSKQFHLHEQKKLIPSSHNINLNVYRGQLTALTGPTGVGKSTVLKGIYRTYLPSSGKILYTNNSGQQIDLVKAKEHCILELRRQEISFVTQFLHALPRQASEDIVAQPLVQQGIARDRARQSARKILAAMNLPEQLWNISPATFSGGEKQRVNLARSMVSRPRLLLLDEPTSSLDPKTTECVVRLLIDLKNKGVGMLAILHDVRLVDQLADHVVELTIPNNSEKIYKENVA